MTTEILILLIAFQVKHIIADYYLQFPYMYENKGKDKGWFSPLFDHAFIHAVGTFIIVTGYILTYGIPGKIGANMAIVFTILFVLFDLITHFVTDRWKATRKTDPSQAWFWQSLGIDQMVHHIVGILIIYALTTI